MWEECEIFSAKLKLTNWSYLTSSSSSIWVILCVADNIEDASRKCPVSENRVNRIEFDALSDDFEVFPTCTVNVSYVALF